MHLNEAVAREVKISLNFNGTKYYYKMHYYIVL